MILNDRKRLSYSRLESGAIDEIDAAIWTGDTFLNLENIKSFRETLRRWERGMAECEQIMCREE